MKIIPKVEEVEPVSMMDLVKQLNQKREEDIKEQENTHPNINYDISPNDSFESDDILEALSFKDQETSRTQADTEINHYETMNEEELKFEIESLLLQNLEHNTEMPNLDELKESAREKANSYLSKLRPSDPNWVKRPEIGLKENTFKVNAELNENMQDLVSHEIPPSSHLKKGQLDDNSDDENNEVIKIKYTEVEPFEFDE